MKLLLSFFVFSLIGIAVYGQESETMIRGAMADQQAAWNAGDIEGFMHHYWNSPEMKFVSKNGITLGWEGTLANYKKSYPDKAAMGTLQFELNEVRVLSEGSAFVIGSWNLAYPEKESVGGHFNLLWEIKEGRWVITVDHTS